MGHTGWLRWRADCRGSVVADCALNGTCDLHSGLTGSFARETATIPEPPPEAMMLLGFADVGFVGFRGARGTAQFSPPGGRFWLIAAANPDVNGAIKPTFKANSEPSAEDCFPAFTARS